MISTYSINDDSVLTRWKAVETQLDLSLVTGSRLRFLEDLFNLVKVTQIGEIRVHRHYTTVKTNQRINVITICFDR